jgi:hypothetical protein
MVRLHAVEKLQERIGRELNEKHLGQEMEVLIEGKERERWMGRTRTNKIVFIDGQAADTTDHTGQLVSVRIDEVGPWSMQGSLTKVLKEAPRELFESLNAKKKRFGMPLPVVATPIQFSNSPKVTPRTAN